jgi:hypothetical protein
MQHTMSCSAYHRPSSRDAIRMRSNRQPSAWSWFPPSEDLQTAAGTVTTTVLLKLVDLNEEIVTCPTHMHGHAGVVHTACQAVLAAARSMPGLLTMPIAMDRVR